MLEICNITKKYDDKIILNDINIVIEKGDIVSILGPSGCGKTTLLNIILGIENPSMGKLILNNKDITNLKPIERQFSIAFQNYALFPHLNTIQNIRYGLKKKKGEINEEYINEVIELMELAPHLNKKVSQLSGGQKQRVSLARALVVSPQLLLLDEPLSALDGMIKEKIKNLILKSARELGLTLIIVTHDPEEALSMSNKIIVLNEGLIQQCDSPINIIRNPSSPFIKEFITDLLLLKHKNIDKILTHEK